MRVEVVRSGGFAGRVQRWAVELDELPAETATEIRSLLDEAPAWAVGDAPAVPDGFRWRLLSDVPAPGLDLDLGDDAPEPAQCLVDLVRVGTPGAAPGA